MQGPAAGLRYGEIIVSYNKNCNENTYYRCKRPAGQSINVAKPKEIKLISIVSGRMVAEENCWFPMIENEFQAEQAVRNSGIPYMIFRPTWFFESLDLMIRKRKSNRTRYTTESISLGRRRRLCTDGDSSLSETSSLLGKSVITFEEWVEREKSGQV
jgi:hypothetical protein